MVCGGSAGGQREAEEKPEGRQTRESMNHSAASGSKQSNEKCKM
jgi:hypothetical protein